MSESSGLLGPTDIRGIAGALGIRPTKSRGQNFVHDAGTVRRIVRDAGVTSEDRVLEVGPGLGSLTLALLETGACVSAVEIDPLLAGALPETIASKMPEAANNFGVVLEDALNISHADLLAVPQNFDGSVFEPTALVANLPYNVAVPVLLTLLENLSSLTTVTVMVQAEVADRLAADPGSKIYGVPSVKAAWYGTATRGAKISRNVFWPVPNVDSALVRIDRREESFDAPREEVFAIIDAAFAQRRKTLRAALSSWAGSAARAEAILVEAGIDPTLRGERLDVHDYISIANAAKSLA